MPQFCLSAGAIPVGRAELQQAFEHDSSHTAFGAGDRRPCSQHKLRSRAHVAPRFELKPENSVCDTWSGGCWETAPNRGWPSVQFRLKATPKISNNKFRRRAAARKDLKEPHAETAGPSTTLRSGRDDNSVAGSATVPSCLFQSLQNCHPDRSVA